MPPLSMVLWIKRTFLTATHQAVCSMAPDLSSGPTGWLWFLQ